MRESDMDVIRILKVVYWWIPKVFMLWQICGFCKCIVCGFKDVGYILYKIVYFSWRLIVFFLFIFIYFYEDIIVYFNWYVLLIFILRKFFLFFKPVYKITSSDKTLYYQGFSQFYVPPGSIFSKLIFWEVFCSCRFSKHKKIVIVWCWATTDRATVTG